MDPHISEAKPGEKSGNGNFIIEAIRLDNIIPRDVLLLKVDVEGNIVTIFLFLCSGFEVIAIESAHNIFEQYKISNILVEWTPNRWKHGIERGTKLLERLYDMGYTIRHYDLRNILPSTIANNRKDFPIAGTTWEIARENLGSMNEYLIHNGYGEANLWLSKEREV